MDFLKEYSKYREEIIQRTMELVAIKSTCEENEVVDGITYPFGIGNYKALEYVLKLGESLGFKTKNIEGVCGHLEYGEGEEIFAVLSHVDVVPAIGDWTNPPYEAVVRDGKIFGRGTSDDKGPAIASIYALKVLKDLGIKLNKRVRLIFGTDEETGSRGLKRYLEVEEKPTYGISPDADFPIIYGEKGICTIDLLDNQKCNLKANGGARYNIVAPSLEFTIDNQDFLEKHPNNQKNYHVTGISAHAMEPDNGKNAIKEFALLVNDYTDSKLVHFIYDNLLNSRLKDMGLDITDKEMGDLTMNMGLLEIDNEARLGLNIRYPHNLNFAEFYKSFESKANEYGLKCVLRSNSKPHYVDPNSEFIKTLHQSYIKYTNDHSPLKTIGGGTYAREFENGVAFGVLFPGEVEMAHETDEFISIDSLMKAGVIITDAIYSVCNIMK